MTSSRGTSQVIPTPTGAPQAGRSRAWVMPLLIVGGWLLNVAWRVWLARHTSLPIAHTDEDSYLNTASALAGGPGGFSTESDLLRRVGYPLLISPAFVLHQDFFTTYRLVQVINAMFNSAILPLAYLLGRQMLQLSRRYAYVAAFAAATLPATAFFAGVAMIDAVMAPLVIAWLLAIFRWIREPASVPWAAVAGALAGAFYLMHARGMVIVGVHLGLTVFLVLRKRIGWRAVVSTLLPLVVLVIVNHLVIAALGSKVYLLGNAPGTGTLRAIASGQGLLRLGAAVGTQLWYLVVITFGLAGIAWAAAIREVWHPASSDPFRWVMGVALVATVGVAVGSSVVLAGITHKPLDAIYGRYVQMLAPFWLLVGLGVLFATAYRPAVCRAAVAVAILAVGGGVIAGRLWYVARRGHFLRYGGFSAPDLMAMTDSWRQMRPLTAALVAIVACLIVVAASRAPRLRLPLLAAVVVVNVITMNVIVDNLVRPTVAASTPTPRLVDVGVRSGEKVAASTGVQYILRFNLSHQVTWADVRWFAEQPPANAQVVLTRWDPGQPGDWDGAKYGFVRLGGNVDQHWAAWRRG